MADLKNSRWMHVHVCVYESVSGVVNEQDGLILCLE